MPIRRSPFTLAVEPVETRSTTASERPSRGAASTEPEIVTSSASTPIRASAAAVETGYEVATRRPARSGSDRGGAASGTAA